MTDLKRLSDFAKLIGEDYRKLVHWAARRDFPPVRRRVGAVRQYNSDELREWFEGFSSKRQRNRKSNTDRLRKILNTAPLTDGDDSLIAAHPATE